MAQVLPASTAGAAGAGAAHDGMIHDAVLDYYGRRLATCSSDRTIKIYDVDAAADNAQRLVDTLRGHEGAVWCVSWAHPKYGNILASCGFDGKVIIWREAAATSQWTRLADFALHTASVNMIAWAPHEVGALLACASSDGGVSVIEFKDSPANATPQQQQSAGAGGASNAGSWTHTVFAAHQTGVNGVSWAPSFAPGSLERASGAAPQQLVRRFATGGSDSMVALWEYAAGTASYGLLCKLAGHGDWVRDVAWSPTVLAKSYVASASQDRTVRIWTLGANQDAGVAANWKCSVLQFETVMWRVSWSLTGNVLAVSGGDNRVSLWKERLRDGGWECIKTLEE